MKKINFKYLNPIYWINRRKYKKIYKILVDAKHIYVEKITHKEYTGMCNSILEAFYRKNIMNNARDIEKYIPEFNREFCNATYHLRPYWWEIEDIESRIKAFNKLIKCYIDKMN